MHHKSLLMLGAMLLAGILLGVSGTSMLHNHRAAELQKARQSGGVMRMIQGVVGVESESQRLQIQEVAERSEQRFSAARRVCGDLFATQRDSMVTSLRTVLTTEQQEKLDAWIGKGQRDQKRRSRRDDQHYEQQ